jgi:hypothetical protein
MKILSYGAVSDTIRINFRSATNINHCATVKCDFAGDGVDIESAGIGAKSGHNDTPVIGDEAGPPDATPAHTDIGFGMVMAADFQPVAGHIVTGDMPEYNPVFDKFVCYFIP